MGIRDMFFVNYYFQYSVVIASGMATKLGSHSLLHELLSLVTFCICD